MRRAKIHYHAIGDDAHPNFLLATIRENLRTLCGGSEPLVERKDISGLVESDDELAARRGRRHQNRPTGTRKSK